MNLNEITAIAACLTAACSFYWSKLCYNASREIQNTPRDTPGDSEKLGRQENNCLSQAKLARLLGFVFFAGGLALWLFAK